MGQAGRSVEERDGIISGSVNSLWELALQSLYLWKKKIVVEPFFCVNGRVARFACKLRSGLLIAVVSFN